MNDEQLIQRFVQGDPQAFDSLYQRHVRKVYKRVLYLIPETDVEDVTQEVFVAAINSLPSFRGDALFSTWLRGLTKNKVAEYYRKQSRKKETMQVDLEHAERSSDNSNASDMEDLVALQHALNNLSDNYREVILLRFAEEMRFKEIADHLNQNLEATKSLFRRAMSALKEELGEKNE
jgi:RNA polymerase sigma-70 factor (ECF subfamily)